MRTKIKKVFCLITIMIMCFSLSGCIVINIQQDNTKKDNIITNDSIDHENDHKEIVDDDLSNEEYDDENISNDVSFNDENNSDVSKKSQQEKGNNDSSNVSNQNESSNNVDNENSEQEKKDYKEACYNELNNKLSSYPDYGKAYFEQLLSGYSESEREYAFNKANINWYERCVTALQNELSGGVIKIIKCPNYQNIYNKMIDKGHNDTDIINGIDELNDSIVNIFVDYALHGDNDIKTIREEITTNWNKEMADVVIENCGDELFNKRIEYYTTIPIPYGKTAVLSDISNNFGSKYLSMAESYDWNMLMCKTYKYNYDKYYPDKSVIVTSYILDPYKFTDEEIEYALAHYNDY